MARPFRTSITPVLTVRGAVHAVAFYEQAFGAVEVYRIDYPDDRIVSEMKLEEARFRVTDEVPEASNLSPESLGGTSVRINILVDDPDSLVQRAVRSGGVLVAPVAEQSYGLRQGRIADPFGHHWLIGRPLQGPDGDWAR